MKISYTQCDMCKEQIPDEIKPRSYQIDGTGIRKTVDLCIKCSNRFATALESLFENDEGICTLTLEDLELSVRSFTCLRKAGISTAGQIADMTWEDLLNVRNLGKRAATEVVEKMRKYTGIEIAGVPGHTNKEEDGE